MAKRTPRLGARRDRGDRPPTPSTRLPFSERVGEDLSAQRPDADRVARGERAGHGMTAQDHREEPVSLLGLQVDPQVGAEETGPFDPRHGLPGLREPGRPVGTELIVLLTPTVIRDTGEAERATTELREKLRDLRKLMQQDAEKTPKPPRPETQKSSPAGEGPKGS